MDEYWNHNSAYHRHILDVARKRAGRALDVGCGEGLLVERLAHVCTQVTGIDVDPGALTRARARLHGYRNVALEQADFLTTAHEPQGYDLLTFVATLHHMDTAAALRHARDLLAPGGDLFVVGLTANKTLLDWCWRCLCLPAVRVAGWWHDEAGDIGVLCAEPSESLAQVRRLAGANLQGATVRRGLYYRYLLRWTKPTRGVPSRAPRT